MRAAYGTRTLLMVGLAAAVAALTLAGNWPGEWPHAFWFWLVACLAGEVMWVKLPIGGATLSMASCFNYAALLVLPRGEALAATVLATILGEAVALRKPAVRVIYNSSHTTLAVAAGSWVFGQLAGPTDNLVTLLAELKLLPFLLSGLTYYAINRVAVVLAIASCERMSPLEAWRRNFGSAYEALSAGAIFSLGALLATHYQGIGMVGTLLVALPLLMACDGLRRVNHHDAQRRGAEPPARERDAA